MNIRFQWDPKKAARNEIKHDVPFAEAATVFQYPLAFIFDDKEHSTEEHREIIIRHLKRGCALRPMPSCATWGRKR